MGDLARQRRNSRASVLLGSLLSVAAATLLSAGPAAGAVTCLWDATNGDVDITVVGTETVTIGRSGTALQVTAASSADPICGALSLAQVRTIVVDSADPVGSPAKQTVVIDMTNGVLEPGNDSEGDASPEIEFTIDLDDHAADELRIKGGNTADNIVVGATGINLNASESVGLDADLTATDVEVLILEGQAGDDRLTGAGSTETGGATSQGLTIIGGSGADELQGGSGNDTFDEGGAVSGSDTIEGEGGTDTASYPRGASDPVTVSIDGVANDGATSGTPEGDNVDVENIRGGSGNDTFSGTPAGATGVGSGVDNTFFGGPSGTDGTDTVTYANRTEGFEITIGGSAVKAGGGETDTIDGSIDNIVGSSGIDDIVGDADANALDGLANDDRLRGGGGDDVLMGGAGNDAIEGDADGAGGTGDTVDYSASAAPVTVSLTTGTATGEGTDTLLTLEKVIGTAGADTITGDASANVLTGGAGNDVLDGGGGADTLHGGAGDDTVTYLDASAGVTVELANTAAQNTVGAGTDTLATIENLTGSPFDDTLGGTAGNNVLSGHLGTDTVTYANAAASTGNVTVDLALTTAQPTGGSGSDTLTGFENLVGSADDDGLFGTSGANVITGGAGKDRIDGRGGNDTENGGDGDDLFVQGTSANGGDTLNGGNGADDKVDYGGRSNAVSITRNGAADDGEAGEGDNVGSDVEGEFTPATTPGAPTGVTATAGDKLATVSWTAPANNGGTEITGYTVTASPGGATASTGGDQRSATVAGLSNGTTYTFTVQATNSRGSGPASAPSNAVMPKAPDGTTGTQGYTMVGGDGRVFNFGTSKHFGSMAGQQLNAPVIGIAHTPTGKGYWEVAKDGGIFTFGDAKFFGSMGSERLNAPVLGMEPTPSGKGYWLFAGDGGIFSFGDAKFHGSMGGERLNAPVVGMAATSTGKGYWLVASDGGIFSFGDASFHGSMGGEHLNQPVFDMAAGPGDKGYWLVARDGGMFTFGSIGFYGSAANSGAATVIGMGATPNGNGYWIADQRGVVFPCGDAESLGDLRSRPPATPIAGFASMPKLP